MKSYTVDYYLSVNGVRRSTKEKSKEDAERLREMVQNLLPNADVKVIEVKVFEKINLKK